MKLSETSVVRFVRVFSRFRFNWDNFKLRAELIPNSHAVGRDFTLRKALRFSEKLRSRLDKDVTMEEASIRRNSSLLSGNDCT